MFNFFRCSSRDVFKAKPTVLSIAGSDSGGGAGIQADIHTIRDLGGFATTILTVITAQNSHQVTLVEPVSNKMLQQQALALASDLKPAAIKIGALGTAEVMAGVKTILEEQFPNIPVVLDPVMVSTSGSKLMDDHSIDYFKNELINKSDLITPNLQEAMVLTGREIKNLSDIVMAANDFIKMGAKRVLIKGGHAASAVSSDYYSDGNISFWIANCRWPHSNNHGSGCTLSSAIATALANGYSWEDAITLAKTYISQGIRLARQIGSGPGPVCHEGWPVNPLDYPYLSNAPLDTIPEKLIFASREFNLSKMYCIVSDIPTLQAVLECDVDIIQLKLVSDVVDEIDSFVKESCKLLRASGKTIALYVNKDWQLALKYKSAGVTGVNLNVKRDLSAVNFSALNAAGLEVGICGVQSLAELAKLTPFNLTYVGCGPITTQWSSSGRLIGFEQLLKVKEFCHSPIVIDGVNLESDIADIKTSNIENVAVALDFSNAVSKINIFSEELSGAVSQVGEKRKASSP
jgi:hydroxymethylpyrimidine kinase/phosphomethylpyrimidine kinase/thiamine-phosphate diphosphorylase